MSGSRGDGSNLPPDKCSSPALLSGIQRRKFQVLEQEAEIMRLSADPLLLYQYLDEFGCRNCGESSLISLRHLPRAMSDCASSGFLIACVEKSEILRGISLDKGSVFLAGNPRAEVSLVPEPFCASGDDKKQAFDLVDTLFDSRPEELGASVNVFVLVCHNIWKVLWAPIIRICRARQP